jgi:2-hydroxychromene-2-carboxylate isomerase
LAENVPALPNTRVGTWNDPFSVRAETPAVKDGLRVNTDNAVARGMFGALGLLVGDEMFWGKDRLDWIAEALNKQG